MRIALGLEYDGSAFCGWQSQPGGCGVQDHLQVALSSLTAEPISIIAAGRTDAGVHATAQVVHFDTGAEREDQAFIRGANANLHPSARVQWACRVSDEFHARFSARSRTYRYLLVNRPVAPGILKGKVGWYHRPLDIDAMSRALDHLHGEHDFSSFRASECQAKTPVKTLHEASISQRNGLIAFHFRANAFLHHMIRNVVGALVYVGAGKHPPEWMAELLAARDRTLAPPTFAPDGLYLAAIEYDAAFALPSFAPHPLFARLP